VSTLTFPTRAVDPVSPRPAAAVSAPTRGCGVGAAATVIATRTLRTFWRTPQLIVVSALTSAMFLLIFRYVFGGAIHTGRVPYVDYLIPAMAAGTGLFASGAVGVADDVESGLFDRLRSLPIPRPATLLGRSLADTALVAWASVITLALGFATGFRFHGGPLSALAALGLCVVFGSAFTWVLIYIGLVAGSTQTAQGMSFLTFPFVFVSSAYVPVRSMPGWMQPVAANQPFTFMVGAVRALTMGNQAHAVLGHSAAWFTVRALVWAVGIVAVFGSLSARRFARS